MLRCLAVTWVLLAGCEVLAGMPEIIGHRGASHDAPENTLAAMKLAWKQQADGSEFDIWLTKDGQLIVSHDGDTKRTAGEPHKIAATSFADLRKLDVGKWKGPAFAGEKMPTLAEMLAIVPAGKRAFIEVKCGPEAVPELVKVLAAANLRPEHTPVIAIKAEVIAAVKKARPDVPAYWLVDLKPKKDKPPPPAIADVIAKAKAIRADGVDVSVGPTLDREAAAKIHAAGLKLYVWTINDAKVAKTMVELGVAGITTDRPGWMREQLK